MVEHAKPRMTRSSVVDVKTGVRSSVSVLVDISAKSPRKLYIFIVLLKKYFLGKNMQKMLYVYLKIEALIVTINVSAFVDVHILP